MLFGNRLFWDALTRAKKKQPTTSATDVLFHQAVMFGW